MLQLVRRRLEGLWRHSKWSGVNCLTVVYSPVDALVVGVVMSFKVEWWSLSACCLVDAVVVGGGMSFKMEWRSMSACIPVDAVVVVTWSCSKCTRPLFGSCKKLEVVVAGPLFVNWIVLLGIFGLLREACTPKTNPHKKHDEWMNCSSICFLQRLAICHSHQMVS